MFIKLEYPHHKQSQRVEKYLIGIFSEKIDQISSLNHQPSVHRNKKTHRILEDKEYSYPKKTLSQYQKAYLYKTLPLPNNKAWFRREAYANVVDNCDSFQTNKQNGRIGSRNGKIVRNERRRVQAVYLQSLLELVY